MAKITGFFYRAREGDPSRSFYGQTGMITDVNMVSGGRYYELTFPEAVGKVYSLSGIREGHLTFTGPSPERGDLENAYGRFITVQHAQKQRFVDRIGQRLKRRMSRAPKPNCAMSCVFFMSKRRELWYPTSLTTFRQICVLVAQGARNAQGRRLDALLLSL